MHAMRLEEPGGVLRWTEASGSDAGSGRSPRSHNRLWRVPH